MIEKNIIFIYSGVFQFDSMSSCVCYANAPSLVKQIRFFFRGTPTSAVVFIKFEDNIV